MLAALAAAQRVNAPGGQPQGRSAAGRRSVDMGMLAHAAALAAPGRHKQLAEQSSIPEGSLVGAKFPFLLTNPLMTFTDSCPYRLAHQEGALMHTVVSSKVQNEKNVKRKGACCS